MKHTQPPIICSHHSKSSRHSEKQVQGPKAAQILVHILKDKFTKLSAACFIEFLKNAPHTTFEKIAQFSSTCFRCISNWERGSSWSWLCCRSGWNASYLPLNQTISAEVDFKISHNRFQYLPLNQIISTKPYQLKSISKSIEFSPKLYFYFVIFFSNQVGKRI